MATRDQKLRSALAILGATAITALLALPALSRQVYAYNDLIAFHLPVRAFYAGCLRAGFPFDWYPGAFCGSDLHAEGQAGLYHPLHLLIYRWLPLDVAFNLDVISGYPLLFLGVCRLLRRWGLARDAACLGGLIAAFGGFPLVHYMHINMVAGAAHVPWLLACIDGVARDAGRRRAGWALGLGTVTASQILLSHPQILWYSAMIEASYALLVVSGGPGAIGNLCRLAAAKAAGILAGAVQWLPTADLARRSIRAGVSPEFLAVGSWHPANVAQWVAPYLYRSRVVAPAMRFFDSRIGPAMSPLDFRTHEFGLYNGAAVIVLLVWLAIRWRSLDAPLRRLARWCAGIGLLGGILAIGEYSPLFGLLLRIPTCDLFRVPARAVLLIDLAAAVLAALAFHDLGRLVDRGERPGWWILRPLLVVPAVSLVLSFGLPALATTHPGSLMAASFSPWPARLGGVALVAGSSALAILAARGNRWALAAIVMLVGIDLGLFGISHVRLTPPRSIASVIEPIPPGASSGRVQSDAYWLTMSGARTVGGANSLAPATALDFTRPNVLRIAGVGWECRRDRSGLHWTPLPGALPQARLVSRAETSKAPNADIDRIDPATTVLVAERLPDLSGEPGQARIVRERPGELSIVAHAPGRQVLVVSERHAPGWRVWIDGREAPLLRTYGDFLGCLIDPGRHRVHFRYKSPSLAAGKRISLLGLGWMALAFAAAWVRRPPPQPLRGPHTSPAARRQESRFQQFQVPET
jgi:hypothetical protein